MITRAIVMRARILYFIFICKRFRSPSTIFDHWKWSMVTEEFTNKDEIKKPSPHYNCPHKTSVTSHSYNTINDDNDIADY